MENLDVVVDKWPVINTPARILLTGCSQSGKTSLFLEILRNLEHVFGQTFDLIMIRSKVEGYGEMKLPPEILEKVHDGIGLPVAFMQSPQSYIKPGQHVLLILDDLMDEVMSSADAEKLFYVNSGKFKISIIFCTQNLFPKGKYAKTIALNCSVKILTANPAGQDQIATLARQVNPANPHYVIDAYNKAMRMKPYNYLVVDLDPHTNPNLRVYTGLLPSEERIFYMPKDR